MNQIEVKGYILDADRYYTDDHFWVSVLGDDVARIGMDPLGVETSGDIVQLVMQEPGTALPRGMAFGSLEAAKFVGPMNLPVAGTITARNDKVLADPGLVQRDPLGDGWLVEVQLTDPGELAGLRTGTDQLTGWFTAKVTEYKEKGVLAE